MSPLWISPLSSHVDARLSFSTAEQKNKKESRRLFTMSSLCISSILPRKYGFGGVCFSTNKTTNHRVVSIGPKASAADDDYDEEGATSSSSSKSEKKKASLTTAGRKRASTTKKTTTRRKASSSATTTAKTAKNVIENLSEVRVKTRTKKNVGKHGRGAKGSSSGEEEEVLLFERRSVFNPSGSHRMEIESK